MKVILNVDRCTGCRICEIVCSIEKEKSIIPRLARIMIKSSPKEGIDEPMICRHCIDAPCAAVCPSEALELDNNGLLTFNQNNCNQCELCIDACIYGVLRISDNDGFPMVCDGCKGSFPCIENCPTGAISIEK